MPQKSFHNIDISSGTFVRLFIFIALAFIAYHLLQVIAAIFLAVVIAASLEPIIRWGKSMHIPRVVSVILIYLGVFFIIASLTYLILPAVAKEVQNFISSYPIYQRELLREVQLLTGIPFYDLFSGDPKDIFITAPEQVANFSENSLQLAVTVFGGVLTAIVTTVISFYLATQEKGIASFLRLVTPLAYEEYALDLWERAQRKMGLWLRSQFLLGIIIGILVYISLTSLGIRYALTFAALAAVLEIIPVIGPILSAAPAVVVAFVQSPILGLVVIILYFIIQQVESHVIVPIVMRKTIGLNPLVVILALLIGGKLAGFLGLLLAVPLASIVVELLTDIDQKKRGLFQYRKNVVSGDA